MTIKVSLDVAGTAVNDFRRLRVFSSVDEYNTASRFEVVLDNPFGRHSDDFTVGNEITIKADQDTDPVTTIFVGILEEKKYIGRGTRQQLILAGRDFTARLQDATIEPIVFTNSEVSTIVTNILDNNVEDVTTTNVDVTQTTISRISFNHQSAYRALKQLATLSGFSFFVDTSKDLNFKERASTNSGITLNNTNIIGTRFDTTREGFANRVWVYGDRTLARFSEPPLDADGGSVFTLIAKPHNTQVITSDQPGSLLQGGIFQFAATVTSGPEYLVNFHDRQLIFISGTDLGYDGVPTSGGSILVEYDREVPIVKFGQNNSSITTFGPKTKVITDKSIKDSRHATEILKEELKKSDPLRKMEIELKGWFTFTVGETVNVVLSDFGLDETGIPIINIEYDFDAVTVEAETVIKVRIDRKITDITDVLASLDSRLIAIESVDTQDTDLLTRLEQSIGSISMLGSYFEIRTRFIGSSFILGNVSIGSIIGFGPSALGRLGSQTGSLSFLGDSRTALETVVSGGFDYSSL